MAEKPEAGRGGGGQPAGGKAREIVLDAVVARIIDDPATWRGAIVLGGFLGAAKDADRVRLYEDLSCSSYVEFARADVLHVESPQEKESRLDGSLVWLAPTTQLATGPELAVAGAAIAGRACSDPVTIGCPIPSQNLPCPPTPFPGCGPTRHPFECATRDFSCPTRSFCITRDFTCVTRDFTCRPTMPHVCQTRFVCPTRQVPCPTVFCPVPTRICEFNPFEPGVPGGGWMAPPDMQGYAGGMDAYYGGAEAVAGAGYGGDAYGAEMYAAQGVAPMAAAGIGAEAMGAGAAAALRPTWICPVTRTAHCVTMPVRCPGITRHCPSFNPYLCGPSTSLRCPPKTQWPLGCPVPLPTTTNCPSFGPCPSQVCGW